MEQWEGFMDLTNKTIMRAYNPFWRLAIYNVVFYTLGIIAFNIFLFLTIEIAGLEGEYPWKIIVIVYLILCIKAFWIVIFSRIERKKSWFDKKLVKVKMIETDGLFGNYKNSNQEIKYCYPKELAVERDKIICMDEEGIKYKLRLIGSRVKMKRISEYFLNQEKSVYLTYGKLTKIILYMELAEPQNSIAYNNIKLLNNKL